VPEFPLCVHAPFSDPGGVLGTRPDALWTAAFRPLDTVGFLLPAALRNILLSTTILLSGLHHAACPLMPSSSILPWLGVHVEVTTDCWRGVSRGGLAPCQLAPTGEPQPVS
jgi:hypothetical protein